MTKYRIFNYNANLLLRGPYNKQFQLLYLRISYRGINKRHQSQLILKLFYPIFKIKYFKA